MKLQRKVSKHPHRGLYIYTEIMNKLYNIIKYVIEMNLCIFEVFNQYKYI